VSVGTTTDSSTRLIEFLEGNRLHKKDFAEMIGVTLSYVYSLIDSKITFSKRITTLERIAVVMGLEPSDFPEYKSPEEPKIIDPGVQYLKIQQKKLGLTNVQLLKKFPRSKRVEIVDLWRGSQPLPLDWTYLSSILAALNTTPKEFYPYWQNRMQQYLIAGGIDPISNSNMLNSVFNSVRDYLKI
jgi:transcriptional regulator with XRE-family HTH domain